MGKYSQQYMKTSLTLRNEGERVRFQVWDLPKEENILTEPQQKSKEDGSPWLE